MTNQPEQAYLQALDLEAAGRHQDARDAYQAIIEQFGHSLFSDAASQAIDRMDAGLLLHSSMPQARAPLSGHPSRPVTFWHGLFTILLVTVQATAVGPFVGGSWILLKAGSMWPLMFVYMVGAGPAALAGLMSAGWALWFCNRRGHVPKGMVLVGAITGTLSVPIWFGLQPWFDIDQVAGLLMFLMVHGTIGGLAVGWLTGGMIGYRMSLAYPPYDIAP